MGDLPRALRFYERSTEFNQGTFYAHFRAGEIRLMMNDLEASLAHFKKSLEKANAQEKEKAMYKIYQVLTYLNRTGEAKDIIDHFRKTNPRQLMAVPVRNGSLMDYIPAVVRNSIAEANEAIAKKDFDHAVQVLQSSLDDYETAVAFRILGGVYLKKGEFEKARQMLTKAYPGFQFNERFLVHFALANAGAGKADQTKMALEKLKTLSTDAAEIPLLSVFVENPSRINPSDIQLNF
jgi:tetratricopeptide (TPR) repeat protein